MEYKELEEAQEFVRQKCNKQTNQELGLAGIIEAYKKILPFSILSLHNGIIKDWVFSFFSGDEIPFNRQMPDHQVAIAKLLGWKKK